MSPVPVYSKEFVSEHNFAGTFSFRNGTGNLIIVRTVTVYYGGDTPMGWYLIDGNEATFLFHFFPGALAGDTIQNQVWINLHLCMPADDTWTISSGNGSDFSLHGYELSLP